MEMELLIRAEVSNTNFIDTMNFPHPSSCRYRVYVGGCHVNDTYTFTHQYHYEE